MRTGEGRAAISRYAAVLHGVTGDSHHVVSPLGAWMLLSYCSTAARGDLRRRLAEVLGAEPSEALRWCTGLMSRPHPLVGLAQGVWQRGGDTAELANWKADLPPEIGTGLIPSPVELDAWAARHTLGLIEKFPAAVSPITVLLLASVVSTDITWTTPFETVSATELGPRSPWRMQLHRALRSPKRSDAQMFIADTARAGRVAVFETRTNGMRLISVIAADEIAATDVIAAAYQVAAGAMGNEASGCSVRSLFDLPLGDEPTWVIEEEHVMTTDPAGREETYTATVPAWSALTELELTEQLATGYPLAAAALADALAMNGAPSVAKQATAANYTATGFQAASITSMTLVTGPAPKTRRGRRRHCHLRFGHPHAVVAIAEAPAGEVSPWHGLPVFSAWVAEPKDPEAAPKPRD